MRVLVLGLDGANMDLIKHWASEGKLPHFEKVLKGGSYGYLESTIPTITIPAWNCLSTGKNPAKIGCFSSISGVVGYGRLFKERFGGHHRRNNFQYF